MNAYKFAQQVDIVHQRASELNTQAYSSSEAPSPLLQESLEELNTALEELHVAEEELRQQNEELLIARQALEVERKRYQELFDFAPDAYLVTDIEGKIIEANLTAANLFKISPKFLRGKLLINFIPENQRRAFRCKLSQLHNLEQIQDWEIQMQTRERLCFDAAISIATIRDELGNPKEWRWLVRDISLRKHIEQQIRAMQLQNLQLQEAAKLKSHFLAMMSHELRTPMNVILGFSQLLLRPQYNHFSPQARSMVERIINSAKHLLALIEDILDFSKLEAGRLELKLEEFNLAELVTTVTEELHCLAEQKNLTLHIHVQLQDPIVINDINRVRQILINLLSNGIKFTEVGSVTVEVQELTKDIITLSVQDTGIGIAEADLQNIFQEFRQVDQFLTRKHNGTGLGLSIVDKLVRLMNGAITVKSQLGEGSTFCVQLPRVVAN
ncbi:ATP-binding protein [Chlorogloeopsis sp. ULAP01]|uniref:sensor histidine kinase n=1 Tax=Chlorogloeopsis sp. ULAP01 TaxID=3056483 RepID=UPI0025AA5B2B|nr:ATP-binding protein [Chlorogloeopsis sp. ULAP01]MDM9379368.1 ATP-binding protein [Chlorogloeopsis sp. ULAP01]